MKTIIMAILAMALLGGCASVSYQTADGTSVSYTRFLATADSINVTVPGATAQINGQKIDSALAGIILNSLISGAATTAAAK